MKTLISAPAFEPITLAEAKLFCRVDGSDDDTVLTLLITAARRRAEFLTGRQLITQTWRIDGDSFPSHYISLDIAPVLSLVSIQYYDVNNALQTLSGATLIPHEVSPRVYPPAAGWPVTYDRPDAVKITVTAGYGPAATDVPAEIRAWLQLRIATAYENRQAVMVGNGAVLELPDSFVDGLLDQERIRRM